MPPERDVGDDVELLARLRERTLEREVEVRGHDQLAWRAALAQEPGELGERAVRRARLVVAVEQRVELVVERADALRQATYSETRARSRSCSGG